jgi:signal transduction histidine kinase
VFRPLILHITERKRVEEALRESEKQLRYLSNQILTAQEAERRRISRQLHEELGQALPALKLELRRVEKKLREDQGAIKEDCEYILKCFDQVIEGVRRLSQDLSPSVLEHFGISFALRRLVDEFSDRYHTKASLNIDDIDHLFLQDAKTILYRIFQEALSNVGRHSQAKHVSVVMKKEDEKVSLIIEDDGKRFDVKQTPMEEATEKGWELSLMDERIRMLSGTLDVRSQEGKGTRLTFMIPMEK